MRATSLVVTTALVSGLWVIAGAATPRFYGDDPLWIDPETEDAAAVTPRDLSDQYDFVENSFKQVGDRADRRAVNINSVDEVPDSSWFTNRIGRQPMTAAEAARGPDSGGPSEGAWTIVSGKTEGITPGMTIRDSSGQIYFIKVDPPSNPEMASGAEVIATKFLHAAGYHVPENYLARIRPDQLVLGPEAQVTEDGRQRPMEDWDLEQILDKAARQPDGAYRVLASKAVAGTPVGPFRYYGTRPDDPNDIFPHEHRRELRGLRVLAAWINHDDSRAINSLDTLVPAGARTIVRHHLIDFGSTFGSGSTRSQSPRAGNEFLWEARPTLITMLTLGFWARPWIKVHYPDLPSIGRFEASYFTPEAWKPEYPNPAFENARPDDRFWAARIVAAFTDDHVRAIVATGEYSNPDAAAYLTQILLERKRKVLTSYLNGTNPVVDLALATDGTLTFGNAAEAAAVARPAESYTVDWSRFDNATGTHTAVGTSHEVVETRAVAPPALMSDRPEFVAVTIRANRADQPAWAQPLTAWFKRATDGWILVGLERQP